MKVPKVGLLLCVSAGLFAQPAPSPPVQYAQLDITYTLAASGALTETRSGEIALGETSGGLDELRSLVIPQRNKAGLVRATRLERIHGTAATPIALAPRTTDGYFVWDLKDAMPGETIRFTVDQPVDASARTPDGWWYTNETVIPLPVQHGSVRVKTPDGFNGSLAALDKTTEGTIGTWTLDKAQASTHAARFTLSSFTAWDSVAAWAAKNCAESLTPGVQQMAARVRAAAAEPQEQVMAAIREVQQKILLRSGAAAMALNCRPVENAIESESGSGPEVQAVLASVLEALGIHAERMLLSNALAPAKFANPAAFTGAVLRADVGGRSLWVDALHLERGAGGLAFEHAKDRALPLAEKAAWTQVLAEEPGVTIEPSHLSVQMDVSFSSEGAMYASVKAEASGMAAAWFAQQANGGEALGSFLKNLQLRSVAIRGGEASAIKAEYVGGSDSFFAPGDHRKRTSFNTARLYRDTITLPDGNTLLAAPGSYAETIRVEVPPDRITPTRSLADVAKPFGHYRAETKVENHVVEITRALDISKAIAGPEAARDVAGMWRTMQRAEDFPVGLTHNAPEDWNAIAAATRPDQLVFRGYQIYTQQGDFEGARYFLQRAADLKQSRAGYYLAVVLQQLGRVKEAETALETQIQQEPSFTASYTLLGSIDFAAGDYQKAVGDYRRLVALAPSEGQLGLARALQRAGEDREAEEAAMQSSASSGVVTKMLIAASQICEGKAGKQALDEAAGPNAFGPLIGEAVQHLIACKADTRLANDLIETYAASQAPFADLRTTDLRSAFAAQASRAEILELRGRLALAEGDRANALVELTAAADLGQDPLYQNQLASALWDSGATEQALQVWADAVDGGTITVDLLPKDAQARLPAPRTFERTWYLAAPAPPNLFTDPEPRFFYARVNPDGTIDQLRDLSEEEVTPAMGAAARKLLLPAVHAGGTEIPTARLIMLKPGREGSAAFYWTGSLNAFLRLTVQLPENFPVTLPQPATAQAQ